MKKTKNVLNLLIISILAVVITACGNGNSTDNNSSAEGNNDKDELVVVSWGGEGTEAQKKAWYEPFTEETGINVKEVTPPSTSQLKAQVESENLEWDIVLMDKTQIDSLNADGDYLEEIPYEEMDSDILDGMPDESQKENGIGAYYWGWTLTYRTDAEFENEPQNWKDFWDTEKFPGNRTMPDQPHSTLEIAMMADNEDEDNLYPVDVDRAFNKLDEIKGDIHSYWDAGAEGVQMLADEEVVMGQVFTTQAASLIRDDVPVEIQWNQGIYAMDYWTLPKGQMSSEAIEFLEFISQPENQAALSNELPYGPVHEDAMDYVDEDIEDLLVTNPDNLDKMVPYDYDDWWGEHRDELSQKWEEWKLE